MPVRDRQTSADATAPESFTLIAVREVRRDRVYCTASWIITILLRIALLCSFGLLAARTFFHAIDFGNAALIETVVHVMQTVVGIIGFRLLPGLRSDIDALQRRRAIYTLALVELTSAGNAHRLRAAARRYWIRCERLGTQSDSNAGAKSPRSESDPNAHTEPAR